MIQPKSLGLSGWMMGNLVLFWKMHDSRERGVNLQAIYSPTLFPLNFFAGIECCWYTNFSVLKESYRLTIFDVIELKNRILVEQINIMQAYVGKTWPTSPDPGSTKQLRQRHATQTIVVEEPPSAVFIVETLEIPGRIFR